MMMLIHRICIAFRGFGKFISVAKEMRVSAAMLLETSDETQEVTSSISHYHFHSSTTFLTPPLPLPVSVLRLTCSAETGQSS